MQHPLQTRGPTAPVVYRPRTARRARKQRPRTAPTPTQHRRRLVAAVIDYIDAQGSRDGVISANELGRALRRARRAANSEVATEAAAGRTLEKLQSNMTTRGMSVADLFHGDGGDELHCDQLRTVLDRLLAPVGDAGTPLAPSDDAVGLRWRAVRVLFALDKALRAEGMTVADLFDRGSSYGGFNGALDATEVLAVCVDAGIEVSEADVKDVVTFVDTSGDGRISADELGRVITNVQKEVSQSHAARAEKVSRALAEKADAVARRRKATRSPADEAARRAVEAANRHIGILKTSKVLGLLTGLEQWESKTMAGTSKSALHRLARHHVLGNEDDSAPGKLSADEDAMRLSRSGLRTLAYLIGLRCTDHDLDLLRGHCSSAEDGSVGLSELLREVRDLRKEQAIVAAVPKMSDAPATAAFRPTSSSDAAKAARPASAPAAARRQRKKADPPWDGTFKEWSWLSALDSRFPSTLKLQALSPKQVGIRHKFISFDLEIPKHGPRRLFGSGIAAGKYPKYPSLHEPNLPRK